MSRGFSAAFLVGIGAYAAAVVAAALLARLPERTALRSLTPSAAVEPASPATPAAAPIGQARGGAEA